MAIALTQSCECESWTKSQAQTDKNAKKETFWNKSCTFSLATWTRFSWTDLAWPLKNELSAIVTRTLLSHGGQPWKQNNNIFTDKNLKKSEHIIKNFKSPSDRQWPAEISFFRGPSNLRPNVQKTLKCASYNHYIPLTYWCRKLSRVDLLSISQLCGPDAMLVFAPINPKKAQQLLLSASVIKSSRMNFKLVTTFGTSQVVKSCLN